MSILIKGMTLDEFTSLDGNIGDFINDEQLDIVEVPEPHGRLIDADKEYKELSEMKVEGEMFTTAVEFSKRIVQNAPTVIEAEGEG